MKQRIRKKRKLGEFQELGFRVAIACADNWTADDFERFARDWLFDVCDRLGLERCMGGWPPGYCELFAARTQASTAEEDRRAIAEWLRHRSGVVRFNVGPLIDVNYDPLEEDDPLWDPRWGPVHYLVIPAAARDMRLACSRPFLAWLSRDYNLYGPISRRGPGIVRGVVRPA